MARKRVLALGPALSRLRSFGYPYERVNGKDPSSTRSWGWRRQKSVKLGQKPRRRWPRGFRVSRFRIKLVSPIVLLKRLRDAYVRMMLAFDDQMGYCGAGLPLGSYPIYPFHMPGRAAIRF